MGWFGTSKRNKELKEARATLKHLERTRKTKMTTTADPSRAITELQPFQVNQEKPRQGLSEFSHKDIWGREIREPDLTNPTRNRWERPLDTIRSFQESIDREGGHTSGPSSQGGRSFDRSAAEGMHYGNRMGNSATPLSYSSGEEQQYASFGAHAGRNHLNETMIATAPVPSHRARNYSGGSGYADTGYGESVNQGSRGNSSGIMEADMPWGHGNGAVDHNGYAGPSNGASYPQSPSYPAYPPSPSYPIGPNGSGPSTNSWGQPNGASYHTSPLQQQVYSTPSQGPVKKNVIRLSDTPLAAPVEDTKRKSWIGRKLSKK
ncbi:hypothetical protein BDD12DRAFT_213385 [Trichophaea hybrida]|nr:hypothetical protein BDD12DRAFT_213385 [Trichophaea hybrida]